MTAGSQQSVSNSFFRKVIEEEDALDKEADEIREKISKLHKEIERLEESDVFFYRQRGYCKFSNGYLCKFTGDCTHKEKVEGYASMFGIRCYAEDHARGRKGVGES
jgi:hypothetical protein